MKKLLIAGSITALLVSCGSKPDQDTYDQEDSGKAAQSSQQPGAGSETGQSVLIPITVSETEQGFNLLGAATAYTMSLDGCASGLTATVTEANAGLRVYKYDQGCTAKLTQFTYAGNVYTPKSGAGFTTWADGDTATFQEPGLNDMTVVVTQQLPATIAVT